MKINLSGAIQLLITISLIVYLVGCQKPPQATLERAQAAVDSAAGAGAVRYAEIPFREAEKLLQSGLLVVPND